MDLKQLRHLLRDGASVVLVEEGQPPLVVHELRSTGAVEATQQEEPAAEVPISSRWPKVRSIREPAYPNGGPASPSGGRLPQDQVLERLNKEILALREQIAAEDGQSGQSSVNS